MIERFIYYVNVIIEKNKQKRFISDKHQLIRQIEYIYIYLLKLNNLLQVE